MPVANDHQNYRRQRTGESRNSFHIASGVCWGL